ncbi:MAG TPA: DUF2911 domain-containing protein [Blastocatellia bacterium]|nr:DUF2911 domain-containing protein [Blastocatellia bacterium]
MKRLLIALALFCSVSACTQRESQSGVAGNSNGGAQSTPASSPGGAQDGAERGRAALRLGGGNVSVEYGRPALKGRDLEKMISPGQEWRMGANQATKLTTDVDLRFGDKAVPKGEYVLKARADDPEKWVLLVQKEGGPTVAEIPLSFRKTDRSVELLTIELAEKGNDGEFALHWGDLMLSTGFRKA